MLYRVPALASSPCANTLKERKMASGTKINQDRRPG